MSIKQKRTPKMWLKRIGILYVGAIIALNTGIALENSINTKDGYADRNIELPLLSQTYAAGTCCPETSSTCFPTNEILRANAYYKSSGSCN